MDNEKDLSAYKMSVYLKTLAEAEVEGKFDENIFDEAAKHFKKDIKHMRALDHYTKAVSIFFNDCSMIIVTDQDLCILNMNSIVKHASLAILEERYGNNSKK